ncbi:MAG: J domain-containing protein [Thermoanaerobaculia bacterium]|nr:J domain-containing protein [Thermoanaerobaculia bacterium]
MDYKDYYTTLGVEKGASAEEIQRAYRKLARKLHPDINKSADAETRFKEINEAYEVLKDPEKRAKYDRFGSAWKQAQQTGAPPPGFEDLFSQFGFGGVGGGRNVRVDFDLGDLGGSGFSSFFETLFGSGRPGGGGARPRGPRRPGRGSDLEAKITLPLEEAGRGGKREITLTDPDTGRKRTLRVTVPKGVRPGQKIRLAGQGGASPTGGPPGDLYLTVELLPHPSFRLRGANLHTEVVVTPWEAALGGTAKLSTLDGDVTIRIPPGSSSGRKIRLKGRGFPSPGGGNGDLLAEIRIAVPERLSEEEKNLFERLAQTSGFQPRA